MGRINATDDWLYQNMPIVNEAIIRELERQADYNYPFSPNFEKKMEKMIRKEYSLNQKKRLQKINFKTIAAIACLAFCLTTFAISASADKISFFDKIKTLWEDSFTYSYIAKESTESKVRQPGYIPARYNLLEDDANNAAASFVYQNNAGRQLICLQYNFSNGSEITFDSEYDFKDQIKITGGLIDVYRYLDGHIYCYFEYKENVFTLYADHLNNGDVEKIFMGWIHN